MSDFVTYPEIEPSEVDWIGDVPSHWKERKIIYGFQQVGSGTTPKSDNDAYYDDEGVPWVTTSELRETTITKTKQYLTPKAMEDHSSLRLYPIDSVLFAMYGATIGRLGLLGVPSTVNQAVCVFAKPRDVHHKYIFYWLLMRRDILVGLSSGGGQPNLSQDDLRKVKTLVPPREEQEQIARFLDSAVGKTDTLVSKKRELIELLQEKRRALVARCVTRGLPPDAAHAVGLDPQPKLKPSGVDWLGDVPEHWDVVQLRRRWDVLDCKHKTVSFVDDEDAFPLASIREVSSFEVDLINANRTTREEYLDMIEGERDPRIGDIIYSRNATVGDASIVATDKPFCMGQDVCLIRSASQHPRYVIYMLRSVPLLEQAESMMIGSTFRRINVGQIKQYWTALPPHDEQIEIAKYLDAETKRIDKLLAKVDEATERLTEYRSALITAAVTGKIDVREVEV